MWRLRLPPVLALAAIVTVMLALARDPDLGPCDWDDSLMAEFDVADRVELAARVPGLARAPEVSGETEITVNGRPAGLVDGPLHVRVMRCVRGDQLAVSRQLMAGDDRTPSVVHGVVSIVTASGEAHLYTEVSLSGLTLAP